MLEIYIKLLPVFAWFFLGFILRVINLAHDAHGALLLKLMFFFTLPLLVLVKLTETQLSLDKLYLPFINIGVNLVCLAAMMLLTRKMEIARATLGVMLVSCMITNNFFIFPFIIAVLGDEALVDAMIFDIGNGISTMTLAYAIAYLYGPEELKLKNILVNIVRLPALWALAIAITLNLNAIKLPVSIMHIIDPVGMLTIPIILVALGIYFNPKIDHPRLLIITLGVRMLLGLLVSLGFVILFELQGVTAAAVILCGAAPIGFNALTFSSLAKLDMAFTSSAVSLSILIGLFSIPILLYLSQVWFKI